MSWYLRCNVGSNTVYRDGVCCSGKVTTFFSLPPPGFPIGQSITLFIPQFRFDCKTNSHVEIRLGMGKFSHKAQPYVFVQKAYCFVFTIIYG